MKFLIVLFFGLSAQAIEVQNCQTISENSKELTSCQNLVKQIQNKTQSFNSESTVIFENTNPNLLYFITQDLKNSQISLMVDSVSDSGKEITLTLKDHRSFSQWLIETYPIVLISIGCFILLTMVLTILPRLSQFDILLIKNK